MIDIDFECFLNERDCKQLTDKYGLSKIDSEQITIAFHKLKWYTESEITLDELMQIFYTYEKGN